jgi:hypothetical protein
MARKKGDPKQNAKTIPQRIARKELIEGGSAEARSGIAKAQARRNLIAGVGGAGGGAMPSTKSAGVLGRNVRGGAVTRAREQKVKVDKRTAQGKRQARGKIDIKKKADREFLMRNERDRMRAEKGKGLRVGQEVSGMYYGKKRTGKIKSIEVKKGINRSVTIVDSETGKEMKINTKTLM